ncbi:MAG: hypothetical protein HY316_01375 [Acidobacteria bacterium]|nr:hypothetical protein [Acidobacteriota bacterium]
MNDLTGPRLTSDVQESQGPVSPSQAPAAEVRGTAAALVLLGLLVLLTRWPLLPPHLFSFDSVNLALSLQDFDPTRNQPQPPGYPLFVMEARALFPLFPTPVYIFFFLQLAISALAVTCLYLLGRTMFSAAVALMAAMLFLLSPIFWYSGLTSPLRPHLALGSVLVAFFCWRAMRGDQRSFYYASVALAIAGGFRPELSLILFPLWLWSGWHCGGLRLLAKGAVLLAGLTWVWLAYLAMASGGFENMIRVFREYSDSQTFQSAAFWGESAAGWRRMVGRTIVWTSLGALPWIWTLPWGWSGRHKFPEWKRSFQFLIVWFAPALLFYLTIHSADPDHLLPVIPIVCLLGGICLNEAEEWMRSRWRDPLSERSWPVWVWPLLLVGMVFGMIYLFPHGNGLYPALGISVGVVSALIFLTPSGLLGVRGWIVSMALLCNIAFFTVRLPLPQGPAGGTFRGLASIRDAFLGGIYETSFRRVQWVSEMTFLAVHRLTEAEINSPGPLMMVWGRDGEPVWRKLAYYYPTVRIYVLDEGGDPGVPVSQARLWLGNQILARYSGEPPIRLPVPKGARLIWFMGGGEIRKLYQVVPVQGIEDPEKTTSSVYTDLPPEAPPFRWKSFEFVPE